MAGWIINVILTTSTATIFIISCGSVNYNYQEANIFGLQA